MVKFVLSFLGESLRNLGFWSEVFCYFGDVWKMVFLVEFDFDFDFNIIF